MKRKLLSVSLILALTAAGTPLSEFEFKGLRANESRDAHPEMFAKCSPSNNDPAVSGCRLKDTTLAGHDAAIVVAFNDRGLVMLSASLSSEAFDDVVRAMLKKYGAESSRETSTIQNRMGATFDNESIQWRFSGGLLIVEKRAKSVDKMRVLYVDTFSADRFAERPAKVDF